jgi:bacterial/archaeal transporter family protein
MWRTRCVITPGTVAKPAEQGKRATTASLRAYRARTDNRDFLQKVYAMTSTHSWFFWAALSACFAALTAVFAKVGIQGVDSDLATLIRTFIILFVLTAFVIYAGKWSNPLQLSGRTWLFLGLSACATGASWVCYFRALQLGDAAKVAPVDKISVVLVALFAVMFLGERLVLREWLGVGLVTAGVIVLALRP